MKYKVLCDTFAIRQDGSKYRMQEGECIDRVTVEDHGEGKIYFCIEHTNGLELLYLNDFEVTPVWDKTDATYRVVEDCHAQLTNGWRVLNLKAGDVLTEVKPEFNKTVGLDMDKFFFFNAESIGRGQQLFNLLREQVEPVWPESRNTTANEFNRMQAMTEYESHDHEPHDHIEQKSENVTKRREPPVVVPKSLMDEAWRNAAAQLDGGVKDPIDAILDERGEPYGEVENNFQRIAHLWNGYLEAIEYHGLLPEDVTRMMQLFKMARRLVLDKPTKDSFDDGHGYLKCEERLCQ